jgi:hypothetical protein
MFVVVVMLFGDRYANPIVTRTGTLPNTIRRHKDIFITSQLHVVRKKKSYTDTN